MNCFTDCTSRKSPRVLVYKFLFFGIWVLNNNFKHLREVLTEVMRGSALRKSSVDYMKVDAGITENT